jgi:hypothetical protein
VPSSDVHSPRPFFDQEAVLELLLEAGGIASYKYLAKLTKIRYPTNKKIERLGRRLSQLEIKGLVSCDRLRGVYWIPGVAAPAVDLKKKGLPSPAILVSARRQSRI